MQTQYVDDKTNISFYFCNCVETLLRIVRCRVSHVPSEFRRRSFSSLIWPYIPSRRRSLVSLSVPRQYISLGSQAPINVSSFEIFDISATVSTIELAPCHWISTAAVPRPRTWLQRFTYCINSVGGSHTAQCVTPSASRCGRPTIFVGGSQCVNRSSKLYYFFVSRG